MLIVCIGMLRSGSTLQYNLASELVEGAGLGQREGFFKRDELAAFKPRFVSWARDEALHVVKVHDWNWELEGELGVDRIKYLSCFRDPVEVATSAKRKFSYSLETSLTALDSAFDLLDRLEIDRRALIHSYATLTQSTRTSALELVRHLGLPDNSDLLIDAVLERVSVRSAARTIEAQNSSARTKTLRFLRRIGLFGRAGRFLRAVGVPETIYFRLRRASAEFDNRSLYHPDHISKSSETLLTPTEVEVIRSRYAGRRWMKEQR